MEITTKTVASPVYEQIDMGDGMTMLGNLIRIENVEVTEIAADSGKVLRFRGDNNVLSERVTIGTADCIDNYEEISALL